MTCSPEEWPSIGGHRLLGDGRGAALVTPDGEIDWWCTPRFDSTPQLWSLLDRSGAAATFDGVVGVEHDQAPAGATTRTVLRAATGLVEVWDGVVDGRIIRLARAAEGDLDLVHRVSFGGFDGVARTTVVETRLVAPSGEWRALVLTVGVVEEADAASAVTTLEEAEEKFRPAMAGHATKRHADRVREVLALIQASTYAPTGASVAAVTTSLPEAVGADRQFDYRYAWLRDGSLAASVAALAGRLDVAAGHLRFVESLGDGVFRAPLFTVDGGPVPTEREVAGVTGWRCSGPVRVGNAASEQVQFDALAFVVEAVSTFTREGGRLRRGLWRQVRLIADRCCDGSPAKTSGIWELREPCELLSADIGRWIALDRAARIARRRRPWTRRRHWLQTRDEVRNRVLGELRPDGRLPNEYGGDPDDVDASALLVVMFGMLDPRDERARALVDAHVRLLGVGPHLRRYRLGERDGFHGVEGTFVPCSWWAVTALSAVGELDRAMARAKELCAVLPRLLPEEFDAETGECLGNLALVWSHTEMARAIQVIDVALTRKRWGRPGLLARRARRRAADVVAVGRRSVSRIRTA